MAGRGSEPRFRRLPRVAATFTAAEWRDLPSKAQEFITTLVQEIDELKAELGKSSRNSSLPPSRDRGAEKAKTNEHRRKQRKRRRRPGGQKGHPGHHRPLVPPDRVAERFEHRPTACRGCGRSLKGVKSAADPLLHQIAEIPKIVAEIHEHVRHRVSCPDCTTVNIAELPVGVPRSSFGPNLRALLALLIGRYRISRRGAQDLCSDVFNISVSLGSVANVVDGYRRALGAAYDEAAEAAKRSALAYMDETGWREKGQRRYLWILVTTLVVLFRIGKRSRHTAREMLGENYAGSLVSDRYAVYRLMPDERHQVCWSHLQRDFGALAEKSDEAKVIGERGVEISRRLFACWGAYRDGRISRTTMQRRMVVIEEAMGALLEDGKRSRSQNARSLCTSLTGIEASLFVFVRTQGVEPTNNIAERGLRPAVQWRKVSFGTQSRSGSEFVERILTVVETCRLQSRNVLDYLRAVIVAADAGDPVPSLVEGRARGDPHGSTSSTTSEWNRKAS